MWCWLTMALAGDVWMHLEAKDDGNDVVLDVPVNGMVTEEAPVPAWRNGKQVDLREEVKALRDVKPGKVRTYVVREDDGDEWPLTLSVSEPEGASVTALALELSAAKGFSMAFEVPLDDAGDDASVEQATQLTVGELKGLSLQLDDDNTAQLRRGGPRTLLRVTGPAGKGLVVTTVTR